MTMTPASPTLPHLPSEADEAAAQAIAAAIVAAWQTGQPADAAHLSAPDNRSVAYRAQTLIAIALDWPQYQGPRAWKVGAANAQAEPTAAWLRPAGVATGPGQYQANELPFLGLEAEIAFRISDVTVQDGLPTIVHTDACCVAIELVTSRFKQGDDTGALLKLADHQSHGSLVLGEWTDQVSEQWAELNCRLSIDGQRIRGVRGTHPCGSPRWGLTWLAQHTQTIGLPLRAGDIVTTGNWLDLVPLREGQTAQVDFDGLPSATVMMGARH